MTKFADQLFDDLIRDHGAALDNSGRAGSAVSKRRLVSRPLLLTAGGVAAAVAATAGVLASGGGTPAYAVTGHPDGTVSLAVYQKSGIAPANDKLRSIGDSRVVLVPVEPGCPSLYSLPAGRPGKAGAKLTVALQPTAGGGVTVNARGIPAGDTLVVALQTITGDDKSLAVSSSALTSGPAPTCVSLPKQPEPGAPGSSTPTGPGSGPQTSTGGGTGPALHNG